MKQIGNAAQRSMIECCFIKTVEMLINIATTTNEAFIPLDRILFDHKAASITAIDPIT